jgi:hypothetical protein
MLEGILVALVGSMVVGPLGLGLSLVLGSVLAGKAVVVLLAYGYILYTLARNGRKTGGVTLALLSAVLLMGSLAWAARWSTVVLIAVAIVWGVRVCVLSRSLVTVGLHGLLCLLGLAAALWAYGHSGSQALAVWSFLLVQALGGCIPPHLTQRTSSPSEYGVRPEEVDPFVVAHQAAQRALGHLRAGGYR